MATLMQAGLQALAAGAYDQATDSFKAASAKNPAAPGPWLGLAEASIRQAITMAPQSVLAHAALAGRLPRYLNRSNALLHTVVARCTVSP